MKRSARAIAIAAFIIIGVCLLAYPSVSNWLAEQSRASVMGNYQEVVEQTPRQDLETEMAKARTYDENLRKGATKVTDPFDPNAAQVTDEDYEACLNLADDGVMGEIYIPSINITLPIYHGTGDEGLQRGVGHLQGTSLPIGGESTHCVLAGHTGLPTTRIFDALDQVQEGDVFIITVLGEKFAYKVCDIQVVLPDESDSLSVQEGRDLVTLVTCTPYGKNTHRLLVTGERCEVPSDGDPSVSPSTEWRPSMQEISLCAAIAAALIGGLMGALSLRVGRKEKLSRKSQGRRGL